MAGLNAQVAPTASLVGLVMDPSGTAIPDAELALRRMDTGFERKARANQNGQYLFLSIPVGVYSLRVAAPGFSALEQNGIRLNVNTATTLNVGLRIGSVSRDS